VSTGPSFFSLSARTLELLDSELQVLREQSKARCAFVLDRTGCILASCGDFYPMNPETLGAIAAGAIAALNKLVSRAESREVSIRFYGSEVERIHFTLITERVIVTLIHTSQIPTGVIRSAVKNFVQQIRPVIEGDQTRPAPLASIQFIEKKLDKLFADPSAEAKSPTGK